MQTLSVGNIKLTWLNGGVTQLDGGAMFGVVPKPLWEKKYEVNEKNQITLLTHPILVETNDRRFLIESGIGNGKLTEKQKRNYGVSEESHLEEDLSKLGLTVHDIQGVIMTHMHFDHACGLTRLNEDGKGESVFPQAKIYTSAKEWDEMRNPNIRSKNTYWEINWKGIEEQVVTFENELEITPEIKMIHTGGHSHGHSIVMIESQGETAIHLADIMPTHAHQNVLWVMAYDDYPMESIDKKQKWIPEGINKNAWFFFYHDAKYRAIKWNHEGNIVDSLPIE